MERQQRKLTLSRRAVIQPVTERRTAANSGFVRTAVTNRETFGALAVFQFLIDAYRVRFRASDLADMSRAQDVKRAVVALKGKGAKQAEAFPKDHRPWGWFETLVLGDRFQVKRILVHPGQALSLQSHVHRAEHWIVVAGTAKVTIDKTVQLLSENQSVYIPLGSVHRLENPGKVPVVLIEVQTGVYLGEDDIIRYEDVYSRT